MDVHWRRRTAGDCSPATNADDDDVDEVAAAGEEAETRQRLKKRTMARPGRPEKSMLLWCRGGGSNTSCCLVALFLSFLFIIFVF